AAPTSAGGAPLPWIVAAGCVLLAVASLVYVTRSAGTATPGHGAIRLAFVPPADLGFNDAQRDYAVISPDGRTMAFTANGTDGRNVLYVQPLDSSEAKLLPGTAEAIEPFWSPDSRSIAFGAQGKLKRIDVSGGSPQILCDAARLTGGAWNRAGVIIFGSDYGSALFRVLATGGD